MRRRKKMMFVSVAAFVILLALCLAPAISSYSDYRTTRIANSQAAAFEKSLSIAIQETSTFSMTNVAAFDWDRMYMFPAYTPKFMMEETIGTKWHTDSSYIGYLINQTSLGVGDDPLSDDNLQKLVFVKDDQVVLDVTLYRDEGDFTSSKDMIERNDDRYVVKKTADPHVAGRQSIVVWNAS
ncbi:hypothetical protein FHS18_006111 [Paenibacillus phyllosphaerae]|uniref:Uncharacterized protein n=1 Tax=Paenibacillus phyllosphaerae TaxID=274593 RepID=A0A7W5FQZ8_9BACL|nr:hypothetical protein [Paenibacillus phyllosphaerae]MBB3113995.1 hypothetical protein [Paenibacillus phyllosphaerae]